MRYEPKVSVAEELAVVIVPKGECNDFNKELRALRKRLEKDCKLYNNNRKKPQRRKRSRKYDAPVCDSTKWWSDLIPIMLVFAAFATGKILQLDYGALDRLLYILTVYLQTLVPQLKKKWK